MKGKYLKETYFTSVAEEQSRDVLEKNRKTKSLLVGAIYFLPTRGRTHVSGPQKSGYDEMNINVTTHKQTSSDAMAHYPLF